MGRQPRQHKDRSLEYPPLSGAIRDAGMVGIRTSITRRQKTIAQYLAMRPILDICKQATQQLEARLSRWWWEQAGIEMKGAQKQDAVSATRLEPETESEEESDGEPTGAAGGGEEYQGASGSSGAE